MELNVTTKLYEYQSMDQHPITQHGRSCHFNHEQYQQQLQWSAAINNAVHHISVAAWSAWSVDPAGRWPAGRRTMLVGVKTPVRPKGQTSHICVGHSQC